MFRNENHEIKYGLWVQGKKIQWFTESEVDEIKEGTFEFENIPNTDLLVLTFQPPKNFKRELSDLTKKLLSHPMYQVTED